MATGPQSKMALSSGRGYGNLNEGRIHSWIVKRSLWTKVRRLFQVYNLPSLCQLISFRTNTLCSDARLMRLISKTTENHRASPIPSPTDKRSPSLRKCQKPFRNRLTNAQVAVCPDELEGRAMLGHWFWLFLLCFLVLFNVLFIVVLFIFVVFRSGCRTIRIPSHLVVCRKP